MEFGKEYPTKCGNITTKLASPVLFFPMIYWIGNHRKHVLKNAMRVGPDFGLARLKFIMAEFWEIWSVLAFWSRGTLHFQKNKDLS